jgi:transcriptional regulator of nitric oxide reductase
METIPFRGLTAVLSDSWREIIGKESLSSVQRRVKQVECAGEQSKQRGEREMEHTEKAVEIYQLRIWIRKISPQIWRRLLGYCQLGNRAEQYANIAS